MLKFRILILFLIHLNLIQASVQVTDDDQFSDTSGRLSGYLPSLSSMTSLVRNCVTGPIANYMYPSTSSTSTSAVSEMTPVADCDQIYHSRILIFSHHSPKHPTEIIIRIHGATIPERDIDSCTPRFDNSLLSKVIEAQLFAPTGQPFEIEWQPTIIFFSDTDETWAHHIADNPFTGFFKANTIFWALKYSAGHQLNFENIAKIETEQSIEQIKVWGEQIKILIIFIAEEISTKYQSFTVDDINKILLNEESLIAEIYNEGFKDQKFIKMSENSSRKFYSAFGNIRRSKALCEKEISFDEYLSGTLIFYLLEKITLQSNLPKVVEQLRKNGLKDIVSQEVIGASGLTITGIMESKIIQ